MQNRQLQTWLSESEYEQFEYEWQEQIELRNELNISLRWIELNPGWVSVVMRMQHLTIQSKPLSYILHIETGREKMENGR